MGKGGRKKGPKPPGERRRKVRDVFVPRPFEGLAAEPELIALREFVPSATAKLTLSGDPDRTVTLGTVLPMAAAGFVRADGAVFIASQVQTKSADISRDLGRSLRWALSAGPDEVLSAPDTTSPPVDGERLQDLLVPDAGLEVSLHNDFSWWLPEGHEASGEVDMAMQRANEAIMPTERVAEGVYWVQAGEKAHIRWIRREPENLLMQALARLSARGELGLGEDSRYAGSFRAHGLLVPVWDLDPEAHAREWAEAVTAFGARLDAALASLEDTPLDATERRSRDGLVGRQLTLR